MSMEGVWMEVGELEAPKDRGIGSLSQSLEGRGRKGGPEGTAEVEGEPRTVSCAGWDTCFRGIDTQLSQIKSSQCWLYCNIRNT